LPRSIALSPLANEWGGVMSDPLAYEDHLFERRMIALRSANEISKWWFALWIATILAFGTVAAVAVSFPDIIERVNDAHAEDI
jgi:hypothetical protein